MSIEVADQVVIILKADNDNNGGGIQQGYVVNKFNQKQLESARNWGTVYKQCDFGVTRKMEPKEIVLDNAGFTVEIIEAAGQSSQGGKLSFWNCLVSKDGYKIKLGIDQTSLLSLIRQSTIINGVVQEKCSLYKSSTAGAIHSGMTEWGGIAPSLGQSVKKTTKYIPGHIYLTKTTKAIYLGKIYTWYKIESKVVNSKITYKYIKQNKPVESYLMVGIGSNGIDKLVVSGKITSLEDLYKYIMAKLDNKVDKCDNIYELSNASTIFGYNSSVLKKPLPREDYHIVLDNDRSIELLDNYIKYMQEQLFRYKGKFTSSEYGLNMLFSSANMENTFTDSYINMVSSKMADNMSISSAEDIN